MLGGGGAHCLVLWAAASTPAAVFLFWLALIGAGDRAGPEAPMGEAERQASAGRL